MLDAAVERTFFRYQKFALCWTQWSAHVRVATQIELVNLTMNGKLETSLWPTATIVSEQLSWLFVALTMFVPEHSISQRDQYTRISSVEFYLCFKLIPQSFEFRISLQYSSRFNTIQLYKYLEREYVYIRLKLFKIFNFVLRFYLIFWIICTNLV